MSRSFQLVFAAFAMAILALLIWNLAIRNWTALNWAILAISGMCCLLVFIRFDHVFTYSYALAMALNACVIAGSRPSLAAVLLAVIAVMYGIRFAVFQWLRGRSHSYRKHVDRLVSSDAVAPTAVKLFMWLATALLYAFHALPFYAAASQAVLTKWILFGALLMMLGFLLEAFADWQMQTAKQAAPERFVNRGLFTVWRHPNYFGQIVLQAGLLVIGLSSVSTLPAAATVAIAPIYIVVLMAFEADRRDKEQLTRYGHDDDYSEYRRCSGSLLPRRRA